MNSTIECADCGHLLTSTRKNTKYCKLCRLFRNIAYVAGRTKKCVVCETLFAQLHRNDELCADCDFLTENNPRGECSFCNGHNVLLVTAGVKLCVRCAKTPELRAKVTQALGIKRKARREQPAEEKGL